MKPKSRGGSDVDTQGLGSTSVLHICTWAIHLCSAAQHWGETPRARAQNTKCSSETTARVCPSVPWVWRCRGSSKAEEKRLPESLSWRLRAVRRRCHSVPAMDLVPLPQCPLLLLWVTRLRACWTFAFTYWATCTGVGQSWQLSRRSADTAGTTHRSPEEGKRGEG